MRTRCGFTLIELLVVVAITAILAALLLPALQSARDRAKQAVCVNNLRQLSQGILMYADANYGWFPASYTYPQVTANNNMMNCPNQGYQPWPCLILPYMGGVSILNKGGGLYGMRGTVFQCPSLPGSLQCHTESNIYSAFYFPALSMFLCGNYSYNCFIGGWTLSNPPYVGHKVADVPASVGLLGDGVQQNPNYPPGTYAHLYVMQNGAWSDCIDVRHRGLCNAAFVDGHVEALPDRQVRFNPTVGGWWSTVWAWNAM